jgi:hypothetical protein
MSAREIFRVVNEKAGAVGRELGRLEVGLVEIGLGYFV